jgi:hypothetical protein
MYHLAARIICPMCGHLFFVCVHARDKADADAKLAAQHEYDVNCPENGSQLRFPAGLLKVSEQCREHPYAKPVEV